MKKLHQGQMLFFLCLKLLLLEDNHDNMYEFGKNVEKLRKFVPFLNDTNSSSHMSF